MKIALNSTGAILIIISLVTGLSTGHLLEFFVWFISGTSIAMILFAFSYLIDIQENILYQLYKKNEMTKKIHQTNKVCPKCNKEYEEDLNSCPYCGKRG